MGPRAYRPLLALLPPCLLALPLFLIALPLRAQVFVVGERTAEANVDTAFRPTRIDLPTAPLDDRGHTAIIHDLLAEQGFAHRELPLGAGVTLLANGNMTPLGEDYKRLLYEKGQSAAPGDRVEVSSLKFENDRLIVDFNGGPYAKHRFLSHISVNDVQLAPTGPVATGCRVTLVFEGGFPEVTAAQIKALLDPIVDFNAHSAAEAYSNTLTPKVREAIKAHQVLVGMDRRMVLSALGEAHDKHREHLASENEHSPIYEEWIYGAPPEPTQFVRFRDGRVVRVEIAALGQPLEIRDKFELDGDPPPELLARTIRNGDAQPNPDAAPSAPPSLRRPGEVAEQPGMPKRVKLPDASPVPPTPQTPGTPQFAGAPQL